VLLVTSVWSTSAPFLSVQCQVVTALKGGWILGHSASSDISSDISPSPLYLQVEANACTTLDPTSPSELQA